MYRGTISSHILLRLICDSGVATGRLPSCCGRGALRREWRCSQLGGVPQRVSARDGDLSYSSGNIARKRLPSRPDTSLNLVGTVPCRRESSCSKSNVVTMQIRPNRKKTIVLFSQVMNRQDISLLFASSNRRFRVRCCPRRMVTLSDSSFSTQS